MSSPRVYLAGAIRDGNDYDYNWRFQARQKLLDYAEILNPLDGKRLVSGVWKAHGIYVSDANYLVPRDLNMIRSADMIIANLLPMGENYPCVGTLMELGVALDRGILVVMAGIPWVVNHPFMLRTAYARFDSIEEAVDFAQHDLQIIARR